MALVATNIVDSILIQDNGLMFLKIVRRAFDDDGTIIGERINRIVLEPGDDVSSYSQRIQRVCQAVWTQAVIDAYRAEKASRSVVPI